MCISFDSIETDFEAQERQEWARITTRKIRQILGNSKALEEEEKMMMAVERKKKKKGKKRKMKSLVFMVL
jgi:hypothetical protein